MKTDSVSLFTGKYLRFVVLFLLGLVGATTAAELKEARVTQVIKDVKLLPEAAAPRPAAVNDPVRDGTAVRTGMESRTELTFADQTLARLGANTIFSFAQGTRNLDLTDGAMLLRVPKNAGGARINTAAITAAITGTTVMIETHPGTSHSEGAFYKFIVLEGTARLFIPGRAGESVLVRAGQMIIMGRDSKTIPNPVDVDISKIMKTSLLITGFPPLPSARLIALQEQQQANQKSTGQLYDTNLVIFGGGTNVSLTDPANTNAVSIAHGSSSPTPISSPPPSKIGPLSLIASPAPYQINNTTEIVTEPAITTNGTTAFGKIYRGPTEDGIPSQYFFNGSLPFDRASGFDSAIADSAGLPIAAFKFQSLRLAGVPKIVMANGPTSLALIALDFISSTAPGGNWSFPGLRLALATENGSITLGPEILFENLLALTLYARGASSDLTISSRISGVPETEFIAQRSINIDGTSLATETLQAIAGANISVGGKAPLTLHAAAASLLIANSAGGSIAGNSTITLQPAGNVNFDGAGGLSLTIDNSERGQIGQGARISANTANLSASSLDVVIDNSNGGSIGSAAIITVNSLDVTDGSTFRSIINNNAGGHIHGSAFDMANISGNLNANGGIIADIADTDLGGSSVVGGQIDGSAIVTLRGQNILTSSTATGTPGADLLALEASIYTNVRGKVGGDAIVNVRASQDIAAPGTALFWIANGNYQNLGPGSIGGTAEVNVAASNISTGQLFAQVLNYGSGFIGGEAAVNIVANNLSVNGSLDSTIDNGQAGTIRGNASITFSLAGKSTVTGDAMFQILGSDGANGAAININGGSYNAGGTFLGLIDGNGTIAFNNASIHADMIKVGVFGSNGALRIGGGSISGDSLLHLYAPGSNGIIDFVANTTLNSANSIATIAANTVTIDNGVIVTIGGQAPASVFTNNANYSGSGGNGSTRGIFAGAGATTSPLAEAPPFDGGFPGRSSKQAMSIAKPKLRRPVVHVDDSSQLEALLRNTTAIGQLRVVNSSSPALPRHRGGLAHPGELHRAAQEEANRAIPAARLP